MYLRPTNKNTAHVCHLRPCLVTGADMLFHLHRLCSVRHQLGQDVTEWLVCVLVPSRLDYCNAVLAGLPALTLGTVCDVRYFK